MSEDDSAFIRCVRHPSQFITGICSSCLVERLSSVKNECQVSSGALHCVESEIVEVPDTESFSEIKTDEVRKRKTLQVLFQLDDAQGLGIEELGGDCRREFVNTSVNQSIGVSGQHECSNSESVSVSSSARGRAMESNASIIGDFHDEATRKGWLSSMLAKKGLRWRSMSVSRREELLDRCKSCSRFHGDQSDRKPNNPRPSIKNSWDPPRHSWDGSMVSKAFSCSFTCLEERCDNSRKIKRCLSVRPPSDPPNQTSSDSMKEHAGSKFSADDKPVSESSLGELFSRGHEEPLTESNVLKIKGKKGPKWSKVWDWSITSPFRDLVKKRENNSERSLSETFKEGKSEKSTGGGDSGARVQSGSATIDSSRISSQFKHQNTNSSKTSSKNSGPDWLKKRDLQLSRSRSLHYSSPGNFEYGLLRFYLTPLRSSRRITSKSRGRRSRSYTRGLFGLH